MAPCVTVLLPARELVRIARENPNYALARQLASATGESPANNPRTIGPGKYLQPAAD